MANLVPGKIDEKPLNPVLGETFEAVAVDGAKIFLEQTSHHPPITHMYLEGPEGRYTVTGWSGYVIWSGMNSATLVAEGHKKITFHDGHTIVHTMPNDLFYNLFMGTMGHQVQGKLEFKDEKNGLLGTITIGQIKRKTQDYFDGAITHNG